MQDSKYTRQFYKHKSNYWVLGKCFSFRTLILTIILLIFWTPSIALQEHNEVEKEFHNISVEHGLSNSSIVCITQDHKGYMWFGTRNGLNRFNGREFEVYRNVLGDRTTISNNYIYSLLEGSHKRLWIGTDEGLTRYSHSSGKFKSYYTDQSDIHSINGNIITALYEDHAGIIWIGTNKGLCHYNADTDNFNRILPKKMEYPVYAIAEDHDSNLWLGTKKGLFLYNKKSHVIKSIHSFQDEGGENVPFKRINSLYIDESERLWIGTQNQGLVIFEMLNERWRHFIPHADDRASLSNNRIRTILEGPDKTVWVATYKGINSFDPETFKISRLTGQISPTDNIVDLSIYPIYQDKKGSYWVGSFFNGIILYDPVFNKFKTYHQEKNNPESLSYNVVSSFAEDTKGNLWVGTEGGGLCYFNRKENTFKTYKKTIGNEESLSHNSVQCLMLDRNQQLWIGTYIGGLNIFDTKTKTSRRVFHNPDDTASISHNYVSAFWESEDGKIWIGTEGGGLNLWSSESESFSRIMEVSVSQFPLTDHVNILCEDNENNLWLGTWDGLIRYTPGTRKIVHYRNDKNDENSLSFNYVVSLLKDREGDLWIGTRQGLNHFDMNTGKFTRYLEEDGLPNNTIVGILEDNRGNIWISTHKGISKLNPQTKQIKNFDYTDGLQSNQFNKRAAFKTISGELLFGGIKGFNAFYPEDIIENDFIPPIEITALKIDNKEVAVDGLDSSVVKEIGGTNEIVLTHDQNDFSFEFVALNYIQPEKNQFECLLENYDQEWIKLGHRRNAVYTNINPGEYIFKVRASNNDGFWNPNPKTIKITINPPYWKTKWAYLIYFTLLYLLLHGIFRFNHYRRKLIHEAEVERKERETEHEINQLKLSFFTNISHEFRTPLTLIQGPVEKLIDDDPGEINNVERLKLLKIIARNSKRLLYLIDQLVDFRKIERGVIKLSVSKGDIRSIVSDIKEHFDHIASEKGISYMIESNLKNSECWFDRDKVEKVLFNLLSNAFKYTPDYGRIKISLLARENDPGMIELNVINSGEGIEKAALSKIFDRFYQAKSISSTGKIGSGIGLALTKSLIELHKGNINVESVEGESSTFIVMLPIARDSYIVEEIEHPDENVLQLSSSKHMIVENALPAEHINPEMTDTQSENKYTLMLVEDNLEVREFLCDILQSEYRIIEAGNGKQGLNLLETEILDLIVSDIMMPEMDGLELCEKIKGDIRTSHIPLILLTAKTTLEDQIEGLQSRADDYLKKPFNPKVLQLRIRNILEYREKFRQDFSTQDLLQLKEIELNDMDEEFLKNAIEIVESHMAESSFKVNHFVEELGHGRTVCYEKIKALTGFSINEFIQNIRLKRAMSLLKQKQLSISEIAYMVGFNDPNYFSKCFKKLYKMNPSEVLD